MIAGGTGAKDGSHHRQSGQADRESVGEGDSRRFTPDEKNRDAPKWETRASSGSTVLWGKPEDIKPYMDVKRENNVILTQEGLTMNSRPKNPKYARNKNVLVVGGSGNGKTRFFVKPNIMQMHSSYCVTDPKGQILIECGKLLERNGYRIKVLNTVDFAKSMRYNPFAYLRSKTDILTLVTTFIANTPGKSSNGNESCRLNTI